MKFKVLILLLALPTFAYSMCYKPHTYEQCLLDGLKGVTSDVAATAIKNACTDKFPAKTKKSLMTLMSDEAKKGVTGTLQASGYGSLNGQIYNGLGWQLVSITVIIKPKGLPGLDAPVSRRLVLDLSAMPNTSGSVCIFIDKVFEDSIKSGFDWSIEQLKVVPGDK